jgi:hypothetical protein
MRLCAAITLISALVSAGFSLVAVFSHQGGALALYSASRSISLALVVCGVEFLGSRRGIAAMAFTMGLVQAFDAVIGAHSHDAMKTIGPAIFAVATFAALVPLLREIQREGESPA